MAEFIPNPTKQKTRTVSLYAYDGLQEYYDEQGFPRINGDQYQNDRRVYAVKIVTDDYTRYLVRFDVHGQLDNPKNILNQPVKGSFHERYGKPAWSFVKVGEQAFDYYITFLRTKNELWLTNAAREIV